MGSGFEQSGNGQSDNTVRLQSDKIENPKFDSHSLLGEAAALPQLKSKGDSADKYLPQCTFHDPDCSRDKPPIGTNPELQPASINNNPNEQSGTKIGRDSSKNITSYSADGYSVSEHQDGKWYYHQDNKDNSKFVEVNNVQMDPNGKVTFHETGLFGKNGSIGGGQAPHEAPTSGLAALQSFADTAAHTVLGDCAANAFGNGLVDAAHAGNTALDRTVVQLDKIPQEFENRDGKLSQSGQVLLDDMKRLELSPSDISNGSNVSISNPADRGAFYDKWKSLPGVEAAVSSHSGEAGVPQYRIKTGPGNACLLFGIGRDGNTFFQMERNDCGSNPLEVAGHAMDYLTYKITDSNVGPSGVSPRTDKRPIIR